MTAMASKHNRIPNATAINAIITEMINRTIKTILRFLPSFFASLPSLINMITEKIIKAARTITIAQKIRAPILSIIHQAR